MVDGSIDGSEGRCSSSPRASPGFRSWSCRENLRRRARRCSRGCAQAQQRGFTHVLVSGLRRTASCRRDRGIYGRDPGEIQRRWSSAGRSLARKSPLERLQKAKDQRGLHSHRDARPGHCRSAFRVSRLSGAAAARRAGPAARRAPLRFSTRRLQCGLFWSGVEPINLPSPVKYFTKADGGVSHFHYLRDNLTLIGMHATLLFELLFRWPAVLRNRRRWNGSSGPSAVTSGRWRWARRTEARMRRRTVEIRPGDRIATSWRCLLCVLAARRCGREDSSW